MRYCLPAILFTLTTAFPVINTPSEPSLHQNIEVPLLKPLASFPTRIKNTETSNGILGLGKEKVLNHSPNSPFKKPKPSIATTAANALFGTNPLSHDHSVPTKDHFIVWEEWMRALKNLEDFAHNQESSTVALRKHVDERPFLPSPVHLNSPAAGDLEPVHEFSWEHTKSPSFQDRVSHIDDSVLDHERNQLNLKRPLSLSEPGFNAISESAKSGLQTPPITKSKAILAKELANLGTETFSKLPRFV